VQWLLQPKNNYPFHQNLCFVLIKKGKFNKNSNIILKQMFILSGVKPNDREGNSFKWDQDQF